MKLAKTVFTNTPLEYIKWPGLAHPLRVSSLKCVKSGFMSEAHTAYCMANRKLINPNGKEVSVANFASATDISTTLLNFDASRIYCVDKNPFSILNFTKAMNYWPDHISAILNGPRKGNLDRQDVINSLLNRTVNCYWEAALTCNNLEPLAMTELLKLGVRRSSIEPTVDSFGDVKIKFRWGYPHERPKEREVTLIKSDITKPENYASQLKSVLKGGVDYFYQKSSMGCLSYMNDYIPLITPNIKRAMVVGAESQATSNDDSLILNKFNDHVKGSFGEVESVNEEYAGLFSSFSTMRSGYGVVPTYGWRVHIWWRNGARAIA